jgi:4-carboxymuconolactone decarboxylase
VTSNTTHAEVVSRRGALVALATVAALASRDATAQGTSQPPAASTNSELSTRQRAIAPIGAATAVGDLPRLNAVLNAGLDAGLTISDAKEILLQLYA